MLAWLLGLAGLTGGGIGIAALLGGGPWMLLFAAKTGKAIWAWLCHRSFWQLVSMGLAGLCLLLLFQRNDARSDAARWQKQDEGHVAELKRITTAKNEQHKTTGDNINVAEQKMKAVQVVKERIINTPNPSGCSTPALEESRSAL